jgi:hypothetical protein
MVINKNTIPDLFPAFNKNLLEVESGEYNKEKHNYIVDILVDKTTHEFAFLGNFFGFFKLAIGGGVGATAYETGDYLFVKVVSGSYDYSGIYRVLYVPNDSVVILDTDHVIDILGGVIEVYKIFRNKLPASPQGTATFDLNGYATGIISEDFGLNNVGIFNIPNSFDRFQFLSSQEYYQNFNYDFIQDNGGFIQLVNVSEDVFIGQTLNIVGDSVGTYDGIYQVTEIDVDGFGQILITLNRAFTVPVSSSGTIISLPKVSIWRYNLNDISDEKIIFNGAIQFPNILDFDADEFDMSLYSQSRFLTTAPSVNSIRLNQRSYVQFYQSANTTVTQFIIEVIDENGFQNDYVVQSNASPDNVLGLAIGTHDLNQIDAGDFITVPARGLPVIQECDKSYCVSLYGDLTCDIIGLQTTNFSHPYSKVLNTTTWSQLNADTMNVTVLDFEIAGVPQVITPTGNTFNQSTVTGQTDEEIYSNEIGLQTGLNIQSSLSFGSGYNNGHWIEVDQDNEFLLRVSLRLTGLSTYDGLNLIAVYKWNPSSCSAEYYLENGIVFQGVGITKAGVVNKPSKNLKGWVGLQSTNLSPANISTPICFEIDYSPCTYNQNRLLFQDRLGSFVGFPMNLVSVRTLESSSDGFEVDRFQVDGVDETTRGFKTIQFSYSEEWRLNSDFLSQEQSDYLIESLTSPNVFIETEDRVLPCVIKSKSEVIPNQKNNNLRRLEITIRVNGTDYSQRN